MKTIHPGNKKEWREWLQQNHQGGQLVWVVCSKKNAKNPTVTHDEAVDEALCYGWIDGTARSLDNETYLQSFTKRKPKSVWSKISKEKVRKLVKEGLMTKAGFDTIAIAKSNGYWSILDEVEALKIPKDLQQELNKQPAAKTYFESLGRSDKKRVLQWLVLAQRAETREKRIQEVITSAKQNLKPKPLT